MPTIGPFEVALLELSLPRFYRSDEDLSGLLQRLKLLPCPSCKTVGALILHGFLTGYSETDDAGKTRRGRRLFCNNRKALHNGCGRTVSLVSSSTLRRLRLGADTLWAFFTLVMSLGNLARAARDARLTLSLSSAYRLWKRFRHRQPTLRTAIATLCAPPRAPTAAAQTLAHLCAAFPNDCPVAAFQVLFQASSL